MILRVRLVGLEVGVIDFLTPERKIRSIPEGIWGVPVCQIQNEFRYCHSDHVRVYLGFDLLLETKPQLQHVVTVNNVFMKKSAFSNFRPPPPFKVKRGPEWFKGQTIDPSLGEYWVDPKNGGGGPFVQVKDHGEASKLIGGSTTFYILDNYELVFQR